MNISGFADSKTAARLMGIVNVTPDSFSDGGKFFEPEAAIERALALAAQGASYIDLGAESTRPGSRAVPPAEQLRRLLPVLSGLKRQSSIPVSIDTRSSEVACACIGAGAEIVNDVSALRHDRSMLKCLARTDCGIVLMHMRGTPAAMQKRPAYRDVVAEVLGFLSQRADCCLEAGIARRRLWIDPGIGFGKTTAHNLELLRQLRRFKTLRLPLLAGVSRKRFLGDLTGEPVPERRVLASVVAGVLAVQRGADVLRVHDVAEHAQALRVFGAFGKKLIERTGRLPL